VNHLQTAGACRQYISALSDWTLNAVFSIIPSQKPRTLFFVAIAIFNIHIFQLFLHIWIFYTTTHTHSVDASINIIHTSYSFSEYRNKDVCVCMRFYKMYEWVEALGLFGCSWEWVQVQADTTNNTRTNATEQKHFIFILVECPLIMGMLCENQLTYCKNRIVHKDWAVRMSLTV
jgi:hypothetical protein